MSGLHPTHILDLASGFWGSAALLTAVDLGLFAAIEEAPGSAAEIARRTGLPERPAGMLLDAMVALGLCERDGERYRNLAEASAYLVPGKPGSLAEALRYNQRLFRAWGRLGDAVRADAPVEPTSYLGRDPELTRGFVEGMHSRILGMREELLTVVDLKGRHRLLDVAGGPGTASVLLCQRDPELRATVIDGAEVSAIGRGLVAAQGLADRVVHQDGDVFADDLGTGHDAVLINGLLHREPADRCRALLARIHAAMADGAVLYILDVMRDASRIGPPFAALFALNMLLTSERGGCHADVDHVEWLEAAGFRSIRIARPFPPMVHTVVRAVR